MCPCQPIDCCNNNDRRDIETRKIHHDPLPMRLPHSMTIMYWSAAGLLSMQTTSGALVVTAALCMSVSRSPLGDNDDSGAGMALAATAIIVAVCATRFGFFILQHRLLLVVGGTIFHNHQFLSSRLFYFLFQRKRQFVTSLNPLALRFHFPPKAFTI